MESKLYILVRQDLSIGQQAVQGAHAVQQWDIDNNPMLVYTKVFCVVPDIKTWYRRLSLKVKKFSCFREPDLNDELTSIACCTNDNTFSNLKMMGQ